jgi:hypothetical protein
MRKQYHFQPGVSGLDAWDVDRLVQLASDLPIKEVPLDSIWEIDRVYWFNDGDEVPLEGDASAPALDRATGHRALDKRILSSPCVRLEGVNPSGETPALTKHDVGFAERVRQQC